MGRREKGDSVAPPLKKDAVRRNVKTDLQAASRGNISVEGVKFGHAIHLERPGSEISTLLTLKDQMRAMINLLRGVPPCGARREI